MIRNPILEMRETEMIASTKSIKEKRRVAHVERFSLKKSPCDKLAIIGVRMNDFRRGNMSRIINFQMSTLNPTFLWNDLTQ